MSASEIFFVRNQFSEELKANDCRSEEEANYISRNLSIDTLCLIAELGLEVATA